jgi:cytosine/adenosine deaminase-related metal-dependent hydrolase
LVLINENENVLHRARWLLLDSGTIVSNGYVRVEKGIITSCGEMTASGHKAARDHGEGVLLPALVNAHTHLELSALHNKLSMADGFQSWVRQLIEEREKAGAHILTAEAQKAIASLRAWGCGAVGEISTLGLTWELLEASKLHGVWFQEYLGNMTLTDSGAPEFHQRLKKSFAGHAPHTLAPEKLKELKEKTAQQGVPFSIHLSESEAEVTFLTTGRGAWADLLSARGIDYSEWGLPVGSPVQYLQALGLLDRNTIAVHLLEVDDKDLHIIKETETRICVCVRSNAYLHQKRPDLERMLAMGLKPCLGTDSLASAPSLSIFDEMAYIMEHWPAISPATVIAMATENGAVALGCDDILGTLFPGKKAVMAYLPIIASNKNQLVENIVHYASDT